MKNRSQVKEAGKTRAEYKSVYIEVTTWECPEDLFEDDLDALGDFKVAVPCHLPSDIAAATAMGAYHSTIPIKYMGLFEYTVRDELGQEITPVYDADWYELAEVHKAFLVY